MSNATARSPMLAHASAPPTPRLRSPIVVVAEATRDAEEGLAELSLTPDVRVLHTRLEAVKTVLLGIVRAVPRLTDEQRERFANNASALVREVTAARLAQCATHEKTRIAHGTGGRHLDWVVRS